ncbi:unnamed protein product [Prorocentrum cordatum]|uniref:Dihydropteridine reductase n=1 Tax=Prorocentrum cordatum TaxID=2364126 RepID=A0ABN9WG18_9DINO|nr:unnamed protein product [Polarella glacialis]
MAGCRVLILGAGGHAPPRRVGVFSARQWVTIGSDTATSPALPVAHAVALEMSAAPEAQARALASKVRELVGEGGRLDAIVNVAGGFAMGSADDPAVVERSREGSRAVYSSVVAAHVASTALRPGGLLVLPGAAAALGPTGWSLPYGTAKAAVHHLVRSLADAESAGLPAGCKTIGIAPQTLDTPQNREAMPTADRGTWATLDEVGEQLEAWCADPTGLRSGMVYVIRKEAGLPAVFDPVDPL